MILKLNYYENLKERWTVDVDGDCISFNLYKNTETSISSKIVKKMESRFQKKKQYCRIY